MRPCEERLCSSTCHVPCFSAQLPLCYSFTNSQIVQVVDLWVGGLPLSIEDSAHNLRYPIHNGLLVSLASFSSPPWRLGVYYETQAVLCTSALLCVWLREEEILLCMKYGLSFFPYHRLGLHDQHLSVIVMWCLEYEFASYSETVF